VVITPVVDRLSRDTTDLLVIAHEIQHAGAGIRSLAETVLDTTTDPAEIIFDLLGVAAKLKRRRILERTARGRADAKSGGRNSAATRPSPHQQNEARKRLEDGDAARTTRYDAPLFAYYLIRSICLWLRARMKSGSGMKPTASRYLGALPPVSEIAHSRNSRNALAVSGLACRIDTTAYS
jgi:hypothetical protein